MLRVAAPQAELGPGGGAVRVRLLGRLHAARQADLPDLRRALHPDVVRHHVELLVLPAVLRRPRVQGGGQAVGEAAVQVGLPHPSASLVLLVRRWDRPWGQR